ncbi:MAG: FAD-dependent oxidoreductase [Eggerthellaceae bacterium]|jgi:thioredoxin reductase (NADPH)
MTDNSKLYDAVIVGGGPAGLTAAIYLARARYRVLLVERDTFGGQITITDEVVNYPGVFAASGKEITETMRKQAEAFGAEFLLAEVTDLHMEGDVKKVETTRGTVEALSVLLATGAHPRSVGFAGEEEFKGHGVAYCATCDGEFFTGREVFVVGGGFAAAEESIFLTKYASHVTVLVRSDAFKCAAQTAEATLAHDKIDVLFNTEVVAVEGDTVVRTIRWEDKNTGETHEFHSDDGLGVFVFVGYAPETDLVKDIANLDERGYVLTDEHQRTSVPGLFAAGDVCVKPLRQVATAVGQAATTATEMERAIKEAQERTGLAGVQPASRVAGQKSEAHVAAVSDSKPSGSSAVQAAPSGELFNDEMRAQLDAVFSRMSEPVVLRMHLDSSDASADLRAYIETLGSLTDRVLVQEASTSNDNADDLPFVEVLRQDETPSGLEFHGVPGGHEFTSFILGLYNVAGPGQPIAEEDRASIQAITSPRQIRVIVGLSCTMCPETVVSAQRIAADNPDVTAQVYDVALFPNLRDKYNVMSVPCVVVEREDGSEEVSFGKKNLNQMLELVG